MSNGVYWHMGDADRGCAQYLTRCYLTVDGATPWYLKLEKSNSRCRRGELHKMAGRCGSVSHMKIHCRRTMGYSRRHG